jgi:hypothetical protein
VCDSVSPCSTDSDSDGINDSDDNCPNDFNPGQEDSENGGVGDGIGDVCDPCPDDADNDAVDVDGICNGPSFNPPKTGANDNCPSVANTVPATHAILTNSMILMVTDIVQETALIHPR